MRGKRVWRYGNNPGEHVCWTKAIWQSSHHVQQGHPHDIQKPVLCSVNAGNVQLWHSGLGKGGHGRKMSPFTLHLSSCSMWGRQREGHWVHREGQRLTLVWWYHIIFTMTRSVELGEQSSCWTFASLAGRAVAVKHLLYTQGYSKETLCDIEPG